MTVVLCAGAWAAHAQSPSTSRLELPGEPSTARRWDGRWQFEMGGTSYSEGRDEGAAAYVHLKTEFNYRFNSMLRAFAEPRLDMYSSRLQERYDNDSYENRLRAGAAYLSLKPNSYLEGRAGAVSQEFLDLPLLISTHRAFPGAQEIVSLSPSSPVEIQVVAQQAIPTSYSLNTERTEKEALPSFQTQSLHARGTHQGGYEWSALLGHYTWAGLPDKVAFQSAVVGNTVPGGEVAPGSKLAYGFDGYFYGLKGCVCGDRRVGLAAGFQRLHNASAPGDSADGQSWSLGPRFVFGQRELELTYTNYFIESDATVAVYSPSSAGYTNRIGDALDMALHFKDQGFTVKGRWVNARTLANKDSQQTMTEFYLGVETDYAPF